MYALIVISSVRNAPEGNNGHIYMVEKVAPVAPAHIITLRPVLKRLSTFAETASKSTAPYTSPVKWPQGRSPGSARKSRRLGHHLPQLLRLGMLTSRINVTNKLESVLQSTVATSCVSEHWICVEGSVLQSLRLRVRLGVAATARALTSESCC